MSGHDCTRWSILAMGLGAAVIESGTLLAGWPWWIAGVALAVQVSFTAGLLLGQWFMLRDMT